MPKVEAVNFASNKTFAVFQVPKIRLENSYKDLTKEQKTNIALCAFSAAVIPVIIINALKKGRVEDIINSFKNKLPFRDKFKAIWKLFEIDNYFEILSTTIGGITGGLLSGLKYAQDKEDREAKYKEGIFEFLNTMTPTTLVALGLNQAKKAGKRKSIPLQAGIILASVVGGMFIANKLSNKINEKIFDKDKDKKDIRKFKPADCLVHIDDLVNLAVLAKIPFAKQLQVDKLLPIIYARTGYEVGVARKKQDNKLS